MSYHDYKVSQNLSSNDPPFASLIMAALRKADSSNVGRIRQQWPELYEEFVERFNAPGGFLPGERYEVNPKFTGKEGDWKKEVMIDDDDPGSKL